MSEISLRFDKYIFVHDKYTENKIMCMIYISLLEFVDQIKIDFINV